MISLDRADAAVDSSVLKQPGGFAWWYAEVFDAQGNGAVIIWSYGLPFLPGYKSAVDRGERQLPESRPSLNVALYTEGQPSFYMLHEFNPEDVRWDGQHTWQFGDSQMSVEEKAGKRHLQLDICCPVADGEQTLSGRLSLEGPIPVLQNAQDNSRPKATHLWTPLALPAQGEFSFQCDDYTLATRGHAYFDRNYSDRALHHLNIKRWLWGHAPSEYGDRIFYVLWENGVDTPQCLGFEIDPQGHLVERVDLTPKFPLQRRTFYGMPTWPWVELHSPQGVWLRMTLERCVDNGPFYLRYFTTATMASGVQTQGSAEVIVPDRVDMSRHRPLVRMRVSTDVGHNSIWLPLFEGARGSRIKRLVKRHLPFGGFAR